ncbi:9111_t:CDS:2, partial [Ambispora leptoticha]
IRIDKNEPGAFNNVQIAASYIPLVDLVKILFEDILKIYENAECNIELCAVMLERVAAAKYALEKMLRKGVDYIYEKEYSLSLKQFVEVLIEIEEFTDQVSKLKGARKFIETNNVKQRFHKLIKEYDTCMKDLHFSMEITNENEREEEAKRINKALEMLRKADDYLFEKEYFLSLKNFVDVLKEIKEFTDHIAKLKGLRKFVEAGKVKQQFHKLIKQYDTCMKDLHFSIITNENEKEEEVKRINKALDDLEKIDFEVGIANSKLDKLAEDISDIK